MKKILQKIDYCEWNARFLLLRKELVLVALGRGEDISIDKPHNMNDFRMLYSVYDDVNFLSREKAILDLHQSGYITDEQLAKFYENL